MKNSGYFNKVLAMQGGAYIRAFIGGLISFPANLGGNALQNVLPSGMAFNPGKLDRIGTCGSTSTMRCKPKGLKLSELHGLKGMLRKSILTKGLSMKGTNKATMWRINALTSGPTFMVKTLSSFPKSCITDIINILTL